MPIENINLMIVFLHQNKDVFPKKREHFARLRDEEIGSMQAKFIEIFEMND